MKTDAAPFPYQAFAWRRAQGLERLAASALRRDGMESPFDRDREDEIAAGLDYETGGFHG